MNAGDEGVIDMTDAMVVRQVVSAEMAQQIAGAIARPRKAPDDFTVELTALVTRKSDMLAEYSYALKRSSKVIVGPSVRFAEVMAWTWGNNRYGARIVDEGKDSVTAMGWFHDLERGTQIGFEVRRRITDKEGRRYNADMIGVTAMAACGIALRNAVIKGVPKVFWIEAFHAVQKGLAGDKDIDKKRTAAMGYLGQMGVTEPMVLATLGLRKIEDVKAEHLAHLRTMVETIREGEATVAELFGDGSGQDGAGLPSGPTPTPTAPEDPFKPATSPHAAEPRATSAPAASQPDDLGKFDPRKSLEAVLRKMGKTTPEQQLDMVRTLIEKDVKQRFTATRLRDVAPSEWSAAWGAAFKRWDPATAAPWVKEVASAGSVSEVEESTGATLPETPASGDDLEPPPLASSNPLAQSTKWLAAEPADLIGFCKYAQEQLGETFAQEHPKPGTWWFVHEQILIDCGKVRQADGIMVGSPVLISTTEPKGASQLADVSLRRMLAKGVQFALAAKK